MAAMRAQWAPLDELITGVPQSTRSNPRSTFQLIRFGDAIAARNTREAIYDAPRLVKDL